MHRALLTIKTWQPAGVMPEAQRESHDRSNACPFRNDQLETFLMSTLIESNCVPMARPMQLLYDQCACSVASTHTRRSLQLKAVPRAPVERYKCKFSLLSGSISPRQAPLRPMSCQRARPRLRRPARCKLRSLKNTCRSIQCRCWPCLLCRQACLVLRHSSLKQLRLADVVG